MKAITISALLIVAFAIGAGATRGSHAAPVNTQTWEYKSEPKCYDDKKLNALGADGWELAGMVYISAGTGGERCVFKRPSQRP